MHGMNGEGRGGGESGGRGIGVEKEKNGVTSATQKLF